MSQQNLEIVRRAFDEMGSEGDEGGVWARDVEVINAEGWVIETVYRGHEGLRRWREDLAEAFGDFRIVVEDVLEVDEQRVLTTQRFVGRFRATEIPFDGRWASILWVRDGKIVRAQGHLSKRRAMRAAGLTPGLSRRLRASRHRAGPRAACLQRDEGGLGLHEPHRHRHPCRR